MSYSVRLKTDTGAIVTVENHQAGGTVAVGGIQNASCSITYNFSYFFYNEIDEDEGLRWLDGKKAKETIETLEEAVETLGTEPHQDTDSYWIPDPGNAGSDLDTLLSWAKDHPEATWRVI